MKFIHYGSSSFDPDKFKQVEDVPENYFKVKPDGGFWASPLDSKNGWHDWCVRENYFDCHIKKQDCFIFEFTGKIKIIDSYDDLENMPWFNWLEESIFGRKFGTERWFSSIGLTISFETAKDYYDAILLTNKGMQITRFTHPMSTNLWDCESLLVLNPEHIKKIT